MARGALLTLFTLLLAGALVTGAVVGRTDGALGAGGAERVTGFGGGGLITRCRWGLALGFGFGFGAGLGTGTAMGCCLTSGSGCIGCGSGATSINGHGLLDG